MNKILLPEHDASGEQVDPGDHIPVDTLSQIIDGTIDPGEKEVCLEHLNTCPLCYEVFSETLKSMPDEMFGKEKSSPWTGKVFYALAASVLLVLIAGGVFMKLKPSGPFLMASITLDQEIRDVLLENETLVWKDHARISRLETLLRARGLDIDDIDRVVLDAPYFQSKGLTGQDEILRIAVENGVAHIRVMKKE